MTKHEIIIRYDEYEDVNIVNAPDVVWPGDSISISVRDYSPEEGDVIQRDAGGSQFREDDAATITIASAPPTNENLMYVVELAARGNTEYHRLSAIADAALCGRDPREIA